MKYNIGRKNITLNTLNNIYISVQGKREREIKERGIEEEINREKKREKAEMIQRAREIKRNEIYVYKYRDREIE